MRYADLFGKTKRDAPAEMTDLARRLAFRAGLLRVLDGRDVWLPLASSVFLKMRARLGKSLNELGAQELFSVGELDLSRLAAVEIQSYKQLPARVYWLDAGGTWLHLLSIESGRETAETTSRQFDAMASSFFNWAQVSCATAHSYDDRVWYALNSTGDLELVSCSRGDYVATLASARRNKATASGEEPLLPLEPIETPHSDTIDALAQFLGVPTSRTAKAVFYSVDGRVVFAVVRGDLQINEEKLKRALGIAQLRFASDDEIRRVGAAPGYASPVGVRGATIVVDESIAGSPNLVAGANREGYHLLNTNVPRDYKPDIVADIALTRAGDPCPNGDGTLESQRGRLLGISSAPVELQSTFLDSNGRSQKTAALELRLDLAATMLGFIDSHHDDKGILWSDALAPFAVHIVALNAERPEVGSALAKLREELEHAAIEYLLDDRAESAGVKFNDADLVGLPSRVTIGPRTVAQNAVEVKRRDEAQARTMPLEKLLSELSSDSSVSNNLSP